MTEPDPTAMAPTARPFRAATRRRWLRRLAVALVIWLAVSYLVARKLTDRRRPVFPEPVPARERDRLVPHSLLTQDGEHLGAWYHEGEAAAPSVLLLHGNGGCRGSCLNRAGPLMDRGLSVLLVTLRAHGDSTGARNDIGFSARHDVVAAVEFLERHRPERHVIVHGSSLGAAAAVFAAPELGSRVAGYVLESPYRDLETAVWNRVDNALPPLLDSLAYIGLRTMAPLVLPNLDRIAPVKFIRGIPSTVPVLILAGSLDRRARPDEARDLFRQVYTHARLVVFEQADHVRMLDTDPPRFWREVHGLVARGTGWSAPSLAASRTPLLVR